MRRGKPLQQIYRPGSGPLRKSNIGIEESESDTNIVINSRQNQSKHLLPNDDLRHKSEGSSPRDKITDIDSTTSRLGDISLSKDTTRRQKKPEQMLYVPRPVAQARELNSSQDFNRNSFTQSNGNERKFDPNDKFGNNRTKRYVDRKRGDVDDFHEEWPSGYRPRQGSEPRGVNNGSGPNWHTPRERDTRSVEPSGVSNRNYANEKIQSKPPSGRRHSTIGLEQDKRHKVNLDNLPPRFRRKFLGETTPTPEETWDGSSLTFQGHSNQSSSLKNPSFHQMGATYNTLPSNQNLHNQNIINSGYHTLPTRPRGRGRLQQDYDNPPGHMYNAATPDRIRSPCNSRPPTPPLSGNRRTDSRPQTPINFQNEFQDSRNFPDSGEEKGEMVGYRKDGSYHAKRDYDNPRKDNDNRRYTDFHRDGNNYNRDNRRVQENYNRGNRRQVENYHRRDIETPIRDNRRELAIPSRDNRRDRETPNRDNRRDGGNYNRERRRDNRRDRDKRSKSRDYSRRGSNVSTVSSRQDDWMVGSNTDDTNVAAPVNSGFRPSLEAHLMPVSPESPEEQSTPVNLQVVSTILKKFIVLTKTRRRSKHRSGGRDGSNSRTRNGCSMQNSTTSIDSRDGFKVPQDSYGSRRRKNSQDNREKSYDRFHSNSRNPSRDSSWDRNRSTTSGTENWREEIVRSRQNSEKEPRSGSSLEVEDYKNLDTNTKTAGIIVLPQHKSEPAHPPTLSSSDHPRYPETRKSPGQQRSLYDPNNPSKPIIVKSANSRVTVPGFSDNTETAPPQICTTDQYGNLRPPWYEEQTEEFKSCHFPDLLRDVKRGDTELQYIINSGFLLVNWGMVDKLRQFLKEALEYLLCRAIKFCQTENVEQHFWKILYHNIIEVTRNAINNDLENKENYKAFLLYLIDEGTKYFEGLLALLEETYDFKLCDFLGHNSTVTHKGLGLVGLALISAQKLFLFLGDLGRYREQVNETSNYGKCRQWYIKSHEINPKNGRPYNQLAILAVYARRKLDAVYYYMRSLMSSNPVPSARENLNSLFDENRRKCEEE
ncbi:hypothetical protein NQ314_001188 [Rhamnusium bicolor]|uniref:Telomerase-binding protein EST1A n=1 Tax=Rhamnusium bicolor TaxID=1586634 RepID=A0AAV8ZSJ8_9CUCU|nr:hypothetical protein NQ314_001188 [Rhamnusium bicolor]